MSMYHLDPGDTEAAFAAGMAASDRYQAHNQALIAGLGSPGGDPLTAGEDPESQPDVAGQVSVT